MFIGHLIAHALGKTRAGQFANMTMMLLFVLALPIASVVGLSWFIGHELIKESSYRQSFGADWIVHYTTDQGSLSAARSNMLGAALGVVANTLLGVWLYRQLIPALLGQGRRPSNKRRRRK
jgi:hypothetical protein